MSNPPRTWVRVSKERMVSNDGYTVWRSSGWFQCWYGVSDQTHRAQDLGRHITVDEAIVAADRHAHRRKEG